MRKRTGIRRRRPATPLEGLKMLVDDAVEAVALPIALLEYYLGCLHRVFVASHPGNDPYLRPWKVAKDGVYLTLLTAAYLQYYFMDVMLQITLLQKIIVFS